MQTNTDVTIPSKTVLVAGTGRSGTSWLGKILDSSPVVFYKPQPDDRTRYPWFREIPSRLEFTADFDHFRGPFAEAIRQTYWGYSANLQGRPDFPKDFLRRHAWNGLVFGMRAWRRITRGRAPIIKIPRWMFCRDLNAITFVFKSVVSNLRLTWIHRHFPEIKIVLILRHPGGYVNSIFRGARDHNWRNVGKRERLDGTILPFPRPEQYRYAKTVDNGSDLERELIYWIVANETPILELADSPALKVVVYEELCARPVEVTKDIFDFAGIPFGESTKQFLRESTTQERPGYYAVYKDPLRTANKWREELSTEQLAVVDEYLQQCSLKSLWDSEATVVRDEIGVA